MRILIVLSWITVSLIGVLTLMMSLASGVSIFILFDVILYVSLVSAVYLTLRDMKEHFFLNRHKKSA